MPNQTQKVQTSLRIDADKLREAKKILMHLGLNYSEAVNIFTNMVVSRRGLPFEVTLPNEITATALKQVRAGKNIEQVDLDTLKGELNITRT
ncbi:MAG: type II toxin-antitoxin system RelB/DinJ family antitoxin [Thiohalomonadales bacterium]